MPIEKLRPAFTFTEDRLAELRTVVPEAFADGAVSWEALREALGAYLEDEGRDAEHFGLTWPGKRQARRLAAQPSKGTLIPAAGEGVDEATTRNLFIEGDNLEVLKLLQKSYAGRVKMIYIDPPYNTGKDFVYKDNFVDTLEEYIRKVGQVDDYGQLLISNTRDSGRFHSNWLNMMYPRLLLARQLLRDDGVVFISIDDNEVDHLLITMGEIFGEENHIATIVRQTVKGGTGPALQIRTNHDYVLVFAKDKHLSDVSGQLLEAEQLDQHDAAGPYRRGRELNKWGAGSRREDSPSMWFPIPGPSGEEVYPIRNDGAEGRWRWGKKKLLAAVAANDVIFERRDDGTYIVYEKIRSTNPRRKSYATLMLEGTTNADGTEGIKALFNGKCPMDFPKPVNLIKRFIEMSCPGQDDIVLDFFAGSCTTAQATIELNHEDGGDRVFVMVQLPESAKIYGYASIAEVGKERIRRVIQRIQNEAPGKFDLHNRDTPEDLGFRVYKLGRSNYKAWQDYQGESVEELETFFDRIETPLVDGWQREHVLAEAMLLQGFPLDSTVTDEQGFKRNRIQRVESDAVGHRLFVCLDDQIADETIAQIQLAAEDVFICLDSALTDEAKLRLGDSCTLRVI